jgi:hypothetical protein
MRMRTLIAALVLLAGGVAAAEPVRQLRTWRADMGRPTIERVRPAPDMLVDYLRRDNQANGYPERPVPAPPDAAFLADVKAALGGIPPPVLRLFDERLAGIFLVDDLGGTGYSDVVVDDSGVARAGWIVLDAAVLKRHTANQWATWKENTPFKPDPAYTLSARIETDAHDNRKNAIQYILLHELAHVLSVGGNVHPPWTERPRAHKFWGRYPYFDLSWKLDRWNNRYASLFDASFPHRDKVSYYFGAKLSATDMEATYAQLAATNFPTLYAATRPGDDFAEAFASYVHVVMLGRPWEITISRDGTVVRTFKACWDEPRCAAKRQVVEKMLGVAP